MKYTSFFIRCRYHFTCSQHVLSQHTSTYIHSTKLDVYHNLSDYYMYVHVHVAYARRRHGVLLAGIIFKWQVTKVTPGCDEIWRMFDISFPQTCRTPPRSLLSCNHVHIITLVSASATRPRFVSISLLKAGCILIVQFVPSRHLSWGYLRLALTRQSSGLGWSLVCPLRCAKR